MDALTFIANLVQSLAWPVAIAFAVWLLRPDLRDLLRILKKVKAGPVEAEFDREVKDLRSETEAAAPAPEARPGVRAQTDPLVELAAKHPRAAILEAWRLVEFTTLRLANSRDLLPPGVDRIPSHHVVRAITKEQLLSAEDLALYYDLRNLRNQAAHAMDFEPSEAAAIDYVKLAQRFVNAADQAANRIQKG